jgi:Tfp pilus assembly protein PilN
MTILLIVFGVLLAILIMLLIYRSTLEMHEDDQLFLTEGESGMAKEQADVLKKLNRVEPAVKVLGALCAVLLLTIAGMWVYTGLSSSGGIR